MGAAVLPPGPMESSEAAEKWPVCPGDGGWGVWGGGESLKKLVFKINSKLKKIKSKFLLTNQPWEGIVHLDSLCAPCLEMGVDMGLLCSS